MTHDPKHHPGRRVADRKPIRSFIDTRAFWSGLAFFIIAGLFIFTVVTYSRESSDRAARRAGAQAQYQQCLAAIPFTVRLNRYIGGVRAVGAVLLLNSVQMHQITQPGTLVYMQQAKNIRRLRKALHDQRAVVSFPVSTPAECRAAQHRHQ